MASTDLKRICIILPITMMILSLYRTRAFVPLAVVRHYRRPTALFSSISSFDSRPKPSQFLKEQTDVVITYLTDVEGDKAYLDRYVKLSKVLTFCDNSNPNFCYSQTITFSQDNAMLIFGGDLVDKGGFDLYVARQLLDLKRRFPTRVFFVCGNRDINKLRILQEMGLPSSSTSSTHTMPQHPGLMWMKGTGRIGDPNGPLPSQDDPVERLQWILGQTMGAKDAFALRKQELEWERNNNIHHPTKQQQQQWNEEEVTDMDVVQSYRQSCHPDGEMGQFLFHSHLALRIGPLLVVHGSLPLNEEIIDDHFNTTGANKSIWDDLTFCMPWIQKEESAAKDYGVTTIDQWLDQLNQFCHDRIKEWNVDIQRLEQTNTTSNNKEVVMPKETTNAIWAFRGGYDYGPSYSALIQYGMGMTPDRKKNPTVVYNTFTPDGMPQAFLFSEEEKEYHDDNQTKRRNNLLLAKYTRDFFHRANLQLILAGHKPQGDMPSPIRVNSSSWVLCCDTSYSGETFWLNNNDTTTDVVEGNNALPTPPGRVNMGRGKSLSFRGEHAVSEVLIHVKTDGSDNHGDIQSVKYHGVLSDGIEYESVNLLDHADNSTIGQPAPPSMVPPISDSPHQNKWWTKSIFSDGSHLFHAGQGFNVWNYYSSENSQPKGNVKRS